MEHSPRFSTDHCYHKNMFALYLDALLYAFMVGAGETYFITYAIHLGHSELVAGLIGTLPIVIGGFIQLQAPLLLNRFQSYKGFTATFAFVQVLSFLALILLKEQVRESVPFLFTLIIVYWGAGLIISPAWSTWVCELLGVDRVRNFFSTRSILTSVGALVGLVVGGVLLNYKENGFRVDSFLILFALSGLARLFSVAAILSHQSIPFRTSPIKFINPFNTSLKSNSPETYQFITFTSFFKIGVFFSASFFAPYMLVQLEFTFLQYMYTLVAAYIGRVLASQYLRKNISRFEINKLYRLSAFVITFIPVLWVGIKSLGYLIFLEVLAGVAWGVFEVCFYVTLFEKVPKEEQVEVNTYYNLVHTICIGIGCLFGAVTFHSLGPSITSYYQVFVISAIIRLTTFAKIPKMKIKVRFKQIPALSKIFAVRPNIGAVSRPIWGLARKYKKIPKLKPDPVKTNSSQQ